MKDDEHNAVKALGIIQYDKAMSEHYYCVSLYRPVIYYHFLTLRYE